MVGEVVWIVLVKVGVVGLVVMEWWLKRVGVVCIDAESGRLPGFIYLGR